MMERPEELDQNARKHFNLRGSNVDHASPMYDLCFQNARYAKELEAKLTRVMENLAESHASEVELEGRIAETNKILLLPIPGDTNQSAASVIAHAKMALKGERSGLSDLATGATGKIRLRGEGA